MDFVHILAAIDVRRMQYIYKHKLSQNSIASHNICKNNDRWIQKTDNNKTTLNILHNN
jgi:hypothetical protein